METNLEIRRNARAANIPLWKIAGKLGISENTLLRKLRYELPKEEQEKIFAIISEIESDEK